MKADCDECQCEKGCNKPDCKHCSNRQLNEWSLNKEPVWPTDYHCSETAGTSLFPKHAHLCALFANGDKPKERFVLPLT